MTFHQLKLATAILVGSLGVSAGDVAAQARSGHSDSGWTEGLDPSFFAHGGMARFQLIQCRLRLDPVRHRKGSETREEGDVYESVRVTSNLGIPSIHYVFQSPVRRIVLTVDAAVAVRIESEHTGQRRTSILDQPSDGAITWTTIRGDETTIRSGATLLHLRAADPEAFDSDYGNLLAILLRGRSIASLNRAANRQLMLLVGTEPTPSAGQVARCVSRLSSPRRADRRAAEQELVAWGSSVLPMLPDRVDDVETQQRINRVRQLLCPGVEDTAASVARLLINDQRYWAAMATGMHPDPTAVADLKR